MTTHVLLTAAVRPADNVSVQLSDPSERLRQYREAFAWWAAAGVQHGFDLIIAENSGADPASYLDAFAGFPESRLQLHAPTSPSGPAHRGKGALEAALVEDAIRTSNVDEQDSVYKVTGRLIVANPAEVFLPLAEKTLVARGLLDNTRIDMRCVGATRAVWMGPLAGMADEVDEDRSVDLGNVLAVRAAAGQIAGALERRRFAVRPQIRGSSGTFGRKYGHAVNRLSERFGGAFERQLIRLAHSKSA